MRAILALLLLCAPVAEAGERAVLIYPRERSLFRRIFYTSHQDKLVKRLAEQYDVDRHVQISTDAELFAIDVDGAKLLVISGHGSPFFISMRGRDERTLDASDRARLARFFARLHPEATIVLQSCDTGRGFAHVVKELAGPSRKVIAARGEIPWNGLEIVSMQPFDVAIACDDGGRRWDCTLRLR
jgi:hypothetical protein